MCIIDDSDSEDELKSTKKKQKLSNALESKVERVDALANELQQKHNEKYMEIQYKLWAEGTPARNFLHHVQYGIRAKSVSSPKAM